ncbi:AraC family transcriptional regulator [Sphingomonas arantia]|uniref:AraC family transcriptional regulator n=1 Tax=Sphingomonas arantia TaxID=1460676 RepID=A0ABW4U1G6_9SPHN
MLLKKSRRSAFMVAVPKVLQQASVAFPYVDVRLLDDRPDRALSARRLGDFGIALLRTPASVAEVSAHRSANAGGGDQLKLIWQLRGRTRYEDVNRVIDLSPGDLVVTAGARDHRLDMAEGHEALVLAFNPLAEPEWPMLIGEALETRTGANAGLETAAAGLQALLGAGGNDGSGELAARAMVDLALRSVRQSHDTQDASEPPFLGRASLSVLRNVGDRGFGPDRLARELGMSRRTLYSRLLQFGITPAGLIKRVRLDRVRSDILREPGRSLLDIALANGFAGSPA